jgi:hypothetical protein
MTPSSPLATAVWLVPLVLLGLLIAARFLSPALRARVFGPVTRQRQVAFRLNGVAIALNGASLFVQGIEELRNPFAPNLVLANGLLFFALVLSCAGGYFAIKGPAKTES